MEKLYSCEELATRYDVKIITVYDWIKKGILNANKIGRQYRIKESEVLRFESAK